MQHPDRRSSVVGIADPAADLWRDGEGAVGGIEDTGLQKEAHALCGGLRGGGKLFDQPRDRLVARWPFRRDPGGETAEVAEAVTGDGLSYELVALGNGWIDRLIGRVGHGGCWARGSGRDLLFDRGCGSVD